MSAGVDCREAAFDPANSILDDILFVLSAKSPQGKTNNQKFKTHYLKVPLQDLVLEVMIIVKFVLLESL